MSVTVDSINYTLSGSNATVTGTSAGAANTTTVTIPSTIVNLGTTYNVTAIGVIAFKNYSNLTSVTIGSNVTSIGTGPFQGCANLTSIVVDSENTAYSSLNNVLFNKAQTSLIQYAIGLSSTSYTIPNTVTNIGDRAFQRGANLTSITIPNGVLTIGITAFFRCSLTSIFIPASVTSIGDSYAFYACPLTSIVVDSGNTVFSSLNNVLFNKAQTRLIQYPIGSSSTAYTIPNTVQTIDTVAFAFCSNLASVTIGSGVLTIATSAFEDCSSLASVTFMGDIPTIGSGNFTANTSDTAYYYPTANNVSRLSPTPPIFANVVDLSLKPSLSTLKSQNALKATYVSNSYNLQELVNSGLYTLPELKQIGYVLGELKAFFTTDTLINSGLFTGSELKQEGLIQSGITFFIIVIVFEGVFSVRRTYTSNNTNEEITQYNVLFNGQYLPTELSRKLM